MIISIKDISKMAGIFIVSFCAVFVCAMFLNYSLDLQQIRSEIITLEANDYYDAQVMTSKVVSAVSGGCLLLTTVVLLCFYVKYYIDTHNKELGILKAMGYSDMSIARGFSIFGINVFLGTALAYVAAHCTMPLLYKVQNEDKILPDFAVHFHPGLFITLVILPTVFFGVIAMLYSYSKLHISALSLINEQSVEKTSKVSPDSDLPFMADLKQNTLKQRKSLVFFITFATFCFSSMMQMSCSMNEIASEMFAIMVFVIGIVLACVTLFIATTSVVKANSKTITMMKVFGYSRKECTKAILGGYRPWAYLGFAIGTGYQYALLKIMISVVFKDVDNVPEYSFDKSAFVFTLLVFIVLYEVMMYAYAKSMNRMTLKKIMIE